MSKKVAERIAEQVKDGRLGDNVTISYNVQGGSGEDLVKSSLVLAGDGQVRAAMRRSTALEGEDRAVDRVKAELTLEVGDLVNSAIKKMLTADEASFVPDSLVGSITLGIGDEAETYYFDADEEACEHAGKPMAPELKVLVQHLEQMCQTCLTAKEAPTKGEK